MVIKRVNVSTFDVFWNKGWESWARFTRTPEGSLKLIGGKQMPTQLFQQFRAIINKKGKRHQMAGARAVQQQAEAAQQNLQAARDIRTT